MSIQELPAELLAEVFKDFIPRTWRESTTMYGDLCSFSLVCHAWQEHAQRALFTSLVLDRDVYDEDGPTGEPTGRAKAWLESPARTRYDTRIISLPREIVLDPQVLAACPKLSSLLATGPQTGYGSYRHPSATGVKQLVVIYPEHFPFTPTPLQQPLECLTLTLVRVLHPKILKTLLHASLDSLTFLGLGKTAFHPALALTSFLATSPLTKLHTLIAKDLTHPNILENLLESLPNLRALEIEGKLEQMSILGRCAPPQLEVLTIILRENPDNPKAFLDRLLQVMRLPKLARLRHLRLPSFPKSQVEAAASGVKLLDECEERSISFFCRYG